MRPRERSAPTAWEQFPRHPARRSMMLSVVAAVAVAAAVAVGIALRSGDASPTLPVGPTAAPAAGGSIADPVDPGAFNPERLPPVETTTEQAGAGPLLPGAPDLTIIAADDTGLQLLDTDTGDMRRIAIRRPTPAALTETLFTVGDTIVVHADIDVVVLPAGTSRPIRLASRHRAVPTVDDDSVWVFDAPTPYVSGTASRVGLDGTVHDQIQLPAIAEPLVGTAEGLMVSAPGAVIFVSGDGQRRPVARGMAVATDGRRLAWLQCFNDMSCAVNVGTVDDPGQVRTALQPGVLPAGVFDLPIGTFSPDGRWLALPLYESRASRGLDEVRISIIDTATGIEAQRLDGSTVTPFDTPSAWSPDSAWLVFVSGSDVRAWRTADGRTVTIDADLRNVRALTVR